MMRMSSFVLGIIVLYVSYLAAEDVMRITFSRDVLELVKITCHIGSLTDKMEWILNGTTVFSCSPPYSAGLCNKYEVINGFDFNTFDFNTTAGTSTVYIHMYMNLFFTRSHKNTVWTCRHGGKQATINTDLLYQSFYGTLSIHSNTTTVDEGDRLQLTCNITSSQPEGLEVSISSDNRDGNLTYVTNSTNVTVTTTAQCRDHTFTCRMLNHHGFVSTTSTKTLIVKCPFQVMYDKTTTTVDATIGSDTILRLYYAGNPLPPFIWYKQISEQSLVKLNKYRTYWFDSYDATGNYIALRISNVYVQDGGTYPLHLNVTGTNIIHVFTVNTPNPHNTEDVLTPAAGIGIGIAVGVVACIIIIVGGLAIRRLKSNCQE